MSAVEIISETECSRGWRYRARIHRDSAEPTEHSVRLDWAEHELWCGGRCPPSRVVEVLLAFLLEHEHQRPLPLRFDAATARRWWPQIDETLPARL